MSLPRLFPSPVNVSFVVARSISLSIFQGLERGRRDRGWYVAASFNLRCRRSLTIEPAKGIERRETFPYQPPHAQTLESTRSILRSLQRYSPSMVTLRLCRSGIVTETATCTIMKDSIDVTCATQI